MPKVLGIEGSANKVGVGIVDETGAVLSNPRKTCVASDRLAQPLGPSDIAPVDSDGPGVGTLPLQALDSFLGKQQFTISSM